MTNDIKHIHWPYRDKRGRVQLTVWRNESSTGGYYYSTEIYRRYNAAKEGQEDNWKSTYKMDRQDLPNAMRLLDIADRLTDNAAAYDKAA